MATLSERLMQLKIKRNLLQKSIAKDNNISLRTYQRYENGEREPLASTIIKLADYFNVSLDYLSGRTDNPKIDSYVDVMNVLFELENNFELCLNELDGKITFSFNNSTVTHYLDFWNKEKSLYEKGNITKEEYEYWKANFQEQIALYCKKKLKERNEKTKSSKE